MRTAVDRWGGVDVLVNNAGVMPLAFFSDHAAAAESWDRAIDINLKGVLNGICAVYDQMIRQGRGHVVNISSIYGNAGTAGSGVYSATKAAVRVLSESLRVEAQGKIKVTVVRPTGIMGTGLAAGIVNPQALVGLTGQHTERFAERVQRLGARRPAARGDRRRRRALLGDHARRPRAPDRLRHRSAVGRHASATSRSAPPARTTSSDRVADAVGAPRGTRTDGPRRRR